MATVGLPVAAPVGGLPAGGSSGQPLQRNSTDPYDVSWAGSAPQYLGEPIYASGLWYHTHPISNSAAASAALSTIVSAPATLWQPFWLPDTLRVVGLAVTGGNASSVTLQAGLYSSDPATGYPAALLTSAGLTFASSSVAVRQAGVAAATIPAGWNWAALMASTTTVTVFSQPSSSVRWPLGVGTALPAALGAPPTMLSDNGGYVASGLLPAAPAGLTMANIATVPMMFFKLA